MKYLLSDIAEITSTQLAGADQTVRNVITDSRTAGSLPDNSIFIAIAGKNHDGHFYIADMFKRGIHSFLVDRGFDISSYPEASFIISDNSLKTLQKLAAYHRSRFKGKIVSVTGSNGKTIVKEWIAQLCPKDIKLFRSPRSFNSSLGVPLSLLMLNGDEDMAIIEAGISLPGEMDVLEKIIKPDIGLITNIGTAHNENFISQRHLAEEKIRLFKDSETIIFHSGHVNEAEKIREFYPDRRLFTIGQEGILKYETDKTGILKLKYGEKIFIVKLSFTDLPSVENTVAAIGVLLAAGIPPEKFIDNMSRLAPVIMRMELIEGINGSRIVNDSYNSDINSLSTSLDYLESIAGSERKIVILSDILGTSSDDDIELYREANKLLIDKGIVRLIGIGRNINLCKDVFTLPKEIFSTTEEFLRHIEKKDFSNSAILVKGSREFRFEKITRILENKIHSTILEVDMDAMLHNLNHYRNKLRQGVKTMAMVKAFSYGSGSFEVASMLQHHGVDYLAVAFADEGIALREAGITMPIVVLNADSWSFATMIEHSLEPEIYSFSSLEMFMKELSRYGESGYPVHIKIDSGMHRLGFVEEDIDQLIHILKFNKEISISSIFTHFAVSESPSFDKFTSSQINLFERMANKIKTAFPEQNILMHSSNSSAIERFGNAQYDMVRLGIGLYGISATEQHCLKNVSTLKSRIVQIKVLSPGETVGYGRRGKIEKKSVIATIPVGYADGLDRKLGNGNWELYVKGKPARIVGNICMDTCMIDITGIPVGEGDEVIIFGNVPNVLKMAEVLDTIPYEIFTSISQRVKRIYVRE